MNILLVAKTILKTFLQALSLIGTGPRRLLSCATRLTPCGSALPLSNVTFPFYPGELWIFAERCDSPERSGPPNITRKLPSLTPGPLSRSLVSPDTFCARGTVLDLVLSISPAADFKTAESPNYDFIGNIHAKAGHAPRVILVLTSGCP